MAPKNPKDKEQIGRVGEAGLFLVSDRTLSWEWGQPSTAGSEGCVGAAGSDQVEQNQSQEVA